MTPLYAALFAVFVWYFSTGAILYLDGLPRASFRASMRAASVIATACLIGLVTSSSRAESSQAVLAFACAIGLWGWQEMSFLMGYVTGPRREAATPGLIGWGRFREATAAVLYHELAIALTAALVVALTWGAPNQTGTATYLVLWAMRLSAKLNLFLGVRNLGDEFLPEHLRYLRGYFRRRRMNLLWPLAMGAASMVLIALCQRVLGAPDASFEGVGTTLVATLLALAIVEHVFMVLPLPTTGLWRWGLRSHARAGAADL